MVVLQHLVPSSRIVDGDGALYSVPPVYSFPAEINGTVDFRTHFNLFSAKTIRELSSAESAYIDIDCEGEIEVTLYGISEGSTEAIFTSPASDRTHIGFPLDYDLYGITVSGKGVLKAASFGTEIETGIVNLALCICTYRMEETIRTKMDRINAFLSLHPEMKDSLKIYITDNGRTLEDIEPAIVIPSNNLGGSGGFTRSMIEAIHDGNSTHIVLNDDDALMDPEVLFRTWSLLRITSREDVCFTGTALDVDNPDIVIESGATFDNIKLKNYGKGVSVSAIEGNLAIVKSRTSTYGGWWFTAFPAGAVIEKGLPLPFFLKMDDAEYGTRLELHNIQTCGISVWHKTFSSKYDPVNSYYYIRNMLVSAFSDGPANKELIDSVTTKIRIEAACMRYESARQMIAGVEDFMKGPDYVFNLCKDGKRNSPVVEMSDLGILYSEYPESDRPRAPFLLRKFTLNGQLLPSKGGMHCKVSCMKAESLYRCGYAVFNVDSEHGFVVRKEPTTAIGITIQSMALRIKLKSRSQPLHRAYSESKTKWTSEESWQTLFK